jgi:hypothetical protein
MYDTRNYWFFFWALSIVRNVSETVFQKNAIFCYVAPYRSCIKGHAVA